MELVNLWLLIRWGVNSNQPQTTSQAVLSLLVSTTYWLIVAAILTIIISRIS